jgi:hypothetical protein
MSLYERDVLANGSLGAVRTLLAGAQGLAHPSIARNPVDGSVWVFGAATSLFDGRLFAMSTTDGFTTTSMPVAVSTSTQAAAAGSSTAIFTRAGAAYQAFGTTLHHGLSADPAESTPNLVGCCRTWSTLATDARGGAPLLAGSSSADPNRAGLEVMSIATRRISYVPRSATPNRSDTVNTGLTTSITGRLARPGVYVGYCEGFPRCARALIWRFGSSAPMVVVGGKGLRYVRVVAGPQGKLWVVWYHGGLVWARRSNTAVTQFGAIVGAAIPGNARSVIHRIAADASHGSLDAFATLRTPDGVEATWTTRMLPGMSIGTRGRAVVGETIRVHVEDAGVNLRGVLVRAGGVSVLTDRLGNARLHLRRAGTLVIRVSLAGYTPDAVKLRVRS